MKTKTFVATTFANILLVAAPLTVLSQGGPLTPPAGVPAPVMKTLDTVEPRIPLVEGAPGVTIGAWGLITISESGSYYLTGNHDIPGMVHGIFINADGVTVDLMGHAIRYTGLDNAGSAVYITSNYVTIENGHILSTTTKNNYLFTPGGFANGVEAPSESQRGITVRNLTVQGVRLSGIDLRGASHIIENCSVNIAGDNGIRLTGPDNTGGLVRNAVVHGVGGTGILARTVHGCRVEETVGEGINAQTVTDSYAASIFDNGIHASHFVKGSQGVSFAGISSRYGIFAGPGEVIHSSGHSGGGHGIFATVVRGGRGRSSGSHGVNSSGINAINVTDSHGESAATGGGHGISAENVTGSFGWAATGAWNGIQATLAVNSYGARGNTEPGRFGLSAFQANSCFVSNGENITHKYNMP